MKVSNSNSLGLYLSAPSLEPISVNLATKLAIRVGVDADTFITNYTSFGGKVEDD